MNFKNRFVCPIPSFLRGELLEYNRLYAYPVIPEPIDKSEFQILDSGGYSLWKQNRLMSKNYIDDLAVHYKKYKVLDNIFCASPDKSQDAKATIKNTKYYLSKYENNICPIIHFPDYRFDIGLLNYQISAYKELFNECRFVFWGGTMAHTSKMLNISLKYKLNLLRDKLNVEWVHFLGAGWGKLEVSKLAEFDRYISFDTLAYYNSAKDKIWNTNDWGVWNDCRIKTSIENAKLANRIVQSV